MIPARMFWDIAIAVLLAVLAAVTTGLAGHLAATKTWQKWLFWWSGIIMVCLIGWQAIRNAKAQRAFGTQLDTIEQNTKTPPSVNVKIPPPEIIKPVAKAFVDIDHVDANRNQQESKLFTNVWVKDISSEPARDAYAVFTTPLLSNLKGPPSPKEQDKVFADFDKLPPKVEAKSTLGPGESVWGTVTFPGFTQGIVDQINSGGAAMFIVGKIFWTDDAGKHRKDVCVLVQPPFATGPMVTHLCEAHNNLRY